MTSSEGGKGRPLDQFIEVTGKSKPTRRPSSHTDRADILRLEERRHPLRGRRKDDNHDYQGSEKVLIEGKEVHINLPQPRPDLPSKAHVEHSAQGQVSPSECQPEFARTRRHPFVVSDQTPIRVVIQAFSNKVR